MTGRHDGTDSTIGESKLEDRLSQLKREIVTSTHAMIGEQVSEVVAGVSERVDNSNVALRADLDKAVTSLKDDVAKSITAVVASSGKRISDQNAALDARLEALREDDKESEKKRALLQAQVDTMQASLTQVAQGVDALLKAQTEQKSPDEAKASEGADAGRGDGRPSEGRFRNDDRPGASRFNAGDRPNRISFAQPL